MVLMFQPPVLYSMVTSKPLLYGESDRHEREWEDENEMKEVKYNVETNVFSRHFGLLYVEYGFVLKPYL